MSYQKKKIIMDVDTGTDDAIALMAAVQSPEIELVAVCTVAGNKPVDITTENTLRVLQSVSCSAPVYKGCGTPLVKLLCPDRIPRKVRHVEVVEGKEVHLWPDYLNLRASKRGCEEQPAASFYVDYLRKATEPVIILAIGPLTNLAVALAMDPTIINNIEEIVIMGGGYDLANTTSTAEYNIWFDPEAAQKTISCGAKVTIVPLDATHKGYLTLDDCKRLREINTMASNFTAGLVEHRVMVHDLQFPLGVPHAGAVHDALALCYILDPTVLKDVRFVHCAIGLTDFTEGQTIVDPRFLTEPRNVYFAFDADPVKFSNMLCAIFAGAK